MILTILVNSVKLTSCGLTRFSSETITAGTFVTMFVTYSVIFAITICSAF